MPDEDWKYVENQFTTATRDSFKRMNILLNDHTAKLQTAVNTGNAALNPILTATNTVKNAWTTAYSTWQDMRATYRSLTDVFEGCLDKLRLKPPGPGERSLIDYWESRVRSVASTSHPDYTYLFPRGRDPFTTDGRDEIVQNIKTLSDRLIARASLLAADAAAPGAPQELVDRFNTYDTLGPIISAFHTTIKAARDTQQGAEGQVDQKRALLENARLAAATEMYGNLGFLMHHHRSNPIQIAAYYDLEVLRQLGPDEEEPPTTPPPGP